MKFNFSPKGLLSIEHLRYKRLWLLTGALLVLFVVVASVVNVSPVMQSVMLHDKIAHMLAYSGLMGWFAQLFRHDLTRLMCVCVFVTMGIGMEYVQGLVPYREFDVLDMIANTSGVLLAWALAYTWVGNLLVHFESLFFGSPSIR